MRLNATPRSLYAVALAVLTSGVAAPIALEGQALSDMIGSKGALSVKRALDLIDIGRLHQVADGAELGRLDGGRDASVAGEDDDPRFGAAREDLLQGIEPRVCAQSKIDDREVHVEVLQRLERGEIACALDVVAAVA